METEIKTEEEYLIDIGQKLEHLRLNMNLTQNDVNKEIGISRKTISSIENGANFSVNNLIKLLVTYNRIDDFLTLLNLPGDFDYEIYKEELKEFNKKYKNKWWFKQNSGGKV
jgi:DNA-binding XRE family transcriptional regulator